MTDWLEVDPENGFLIGPDGCHYVNEHQAAHFALLKLCGCGSPDEAYNFCRDALMLFDRRGAKGENWIQAEVALAEMIQKRPAEAAHVFAHMLDNLKLIEHGGSVGGSWLTEDGARIVDMGPTTEELMDAEWPQEPTP